MRSESRRGRRDEGVPSSSPCCCCCWSAALPWEEDEEEVLVLGSCWLEEVEVEEELDVEGIVEVGEVTPGPKKLFFIAGI